MLIKLLGILSTVPLLTAVFPVRAFGISSLVINSSLERTVSVKDSAEDIEQACTAAVQKAMRRFEETRNVDVASMDLVNLSERYSNYPANAPYGIAFNLEGRAVPDIMNSSQLLMSISTQVITECSIISLVIIGQNQTDYNSTYGLAGDSVSAFQQCQEPGMESALLRWGEVYCF